MKTKQFFYLMILIMISGFGVVVGAFYWGNQQLEKEASIVANLQTDRDIARDKIIALQKAKQNTDLSSEAERLLSVLLPTTKKQETLVADVIYTASAEAGIPANSLTSLSFSSSDDPSELSGTETYTEVPGVLSYPFNLNLQNISYDTLLKFLQEVENNGRLVQVDNLQISPDKANPGEISNVLLSMRAFLKP